MRQKISLVVREGLPAEIAHRYDAGAGDRILSSADSFCARIGGESHLFRLGSTPVRRAASRARPLSRLLRLDKSSAVLNQARDGIAVLYGGAAFFYDLERREVRRTAGLRQSRNALHCGIAVTDRGMFFGEYGRNPGHAPVPVWQSADGGRRWRIVHEIAGVRHVHGVHADPHSGSLWIPTGDYAGECYVFEVPEADFSRTVRHGDGTQRWRTASMFFEPDRVVWAMDSPLETSHLQCLDRATGRLEQGRAFPGPVWYGKRLADGSALLASSVEIGPGVRSRSAHLFHSRNLTDWHEVAAWRKDRWPMPWFKFGVVAFADGTQPPDDFVLFGEGLEGIDGKVLRVALVAS